MAKYIFPNRWIDKRDNPLISKDKTTTLSYHFVCGYRALKKSNKEMVVQKLSNIINFRTLLKVKNIL